MSREWSNIAFRILQLTFLELSQQKKRKKEKKEKSQSAWSERLSEKIWSQPTILLTVKKLPAEKVHPKLSKICEIVNLAVKNKKLAASY